MESLFNKILKIDFNTGFSYETGKIFKNTILYKAHPVTASYLRPQVVPKYQKYDCSAKIG